VWFQPDGIVKIIIIYNISKTQGCDGNFSNIVLKIERFAGKIMA
jgi:hypothetical protein